MRRALVLALLLKLILLGLLWKLFFSHPQAEHMRVPTDQVERHFLRSPPHA